MNTAQKAELAKFLKHKENIEKWVRHNGIYGVMHRTAKHLLPGRKFDFKLNLGGGSHTNGKLVVVGIPELVYPMDKEIVFSVTKALVGHETEHIYSTDFDVYVAFQGKVQKYFKDNFGLKITPKLGANMLNSTEDGRIEKRLVNRYKGYKKHIQLLNGIFWREQPCPGQNEMREFLHCITSMCVTGLKMKEWEVYYEGTEADALLDQIHPIILKAINNPSAQGCADDTMDIIEVIAPYIAEKLQDIKNQQALEELQDKPPSESNNPEEGGESQPGNSESTHFYEPYLEPEEKDGKSGDGESDEDSDGDEGEESDDSKDSSKSKDKDGEEGEDEGDDSDEESDGESKSKSKSKSKEEDGEDEEGDLDGDADGESADESEGDSKGEESKEGKDGEKSPEQNDSEEGGNPSDENAENEQKSPNLTPEEIEALMDELIESLKEEVYEEAQAAIKQGEREAEKERKAQEAERTYLGHLTPEEVRGIDKSVVFKNLDPVRNRREYLPADVLKRGRHMNKELKRLLINKPAFTSRNRKNGILDTNALWKKGIKQHDMFMKKGVPVDSSYVFNILVDASGSMFGGVEGGGTKLDKATEATAMIEEGLRDLVPTRISYFTGTDNIVVHSTVKDFNQNSKDTLSWSRIPALQNWANRDGYSIKVGTQELLKRPEQRKVLIVLSDGIPTEPTQSAGQKEVMQAVREARQAGVIVIAIAFGSEREMENNKAVYKEMYQKGIIMVRPDEIHKHLAKTIENELNR